MFKIKGLIELGSNDYFILKDLSLKIKSKSKFRGRLDNQVIKSNFKYKTTSKNVLKFLKKLMLNKLFKLNCIYSNFFRSYLIF